MSKFRTSALPAPGRPGLLPAIIPDVGVGKLQNMLDGEYVWYYFGSMKTKTSVTLSGVLLRSIETHAAEFRSRSEFVEAAVDHFIRHLERQEAERKDLDILNRRAKSLNEEAEDVLGYQVPL